MTMECYILDDSGNPAREPSVRKWAEWYGSLNNRIIAQDELPRGVISTVFLGLDHSFGGGKPPVLWETVIFGGKHNGKQERYTSKEAALAGHAELKALAEQGDAA